MKNIKINIQNQNLSNHIDIKKIKKYKKIIMEFIFFKKNF